MSAVIPTPACTHRSRRAPLAATSAARSAAGRLHADERAHAGISAFQFLRDQSVFDVRHAGGAVAVERGAEESEIGHRLHQFPREPAGAVAFLDDRNQIVFDELARRGAHQALVVIQQRLEVDEVHTMEFDGRHYVSPHKSQQTANGKPFKVAERRAVANHKITRLHNYQIYSTFQPLTSISGFAAPRLLARYVAVISRFSPGSSEM